MITETRISEGTVGNRNGYCFLIYFDSRQYPNFISALYKTRAETKRKLNKYLKTEEFDLYGSAEKQKRR